MKVYVAAYSMELDRARFWMGKLRAAGHEIALDWTIQVEQARVADQPDWALPIAERVKIAETDYLAAWGSDLVWTLLPQYSGAGVHSELGIGLASRNTTGPVRHVVCSGAWRRNVFSALADRVFDTDEAAFEFICGLPG